jgi:hypothetical protein
MDARDKRFVVSDDLLGISPERGLIGAEDAMVL